MVPSYNRETGASKELMQCVGSMRWLLVKRSGKGVSLDVRALQSTIIVRTGLGRDLMEGLAAPNGGVALRRARLMMMERVSIS